MEVSRSPSRPRTAACLPEPQVAIETCSITYAATPPISNEPHRGSAASLSIPLAAVASPHGSAPPHSAATSEIHPEASHFSITGPRNIMASEAFRENAAAVARGLSVEELQSAGGSRERRQSGSFTSRLASSPSAALPTAAGAMVMGGHSHSKSFTYRKG